MEKNITAYYNSIREIKLAYAEKRADVTHNYKCGQDKLDTEIQRLRNDINYHSSLLRKGNDCRDKMDELTDQLSTLRSAKTELDFARRREFNALQREQWEKMREFEAKQAEGKVVVAQ